MMTTMAALLGALPLALGHGRRRRSCAGRSASPSSAACIVSQVLTLYTTPVVYLYLDRAALVSGASGSARPRGPGSRTRGA